MAMQASPTLSAELEALQSEIAAWPEGVHRAEARTLINMIDREA